MADTLAGLVDDLVGADAEFRQKHTQYLNTQAIHARTLEERAEAKEHRLNVIRSVEGILKDLKREK